MQLKYTRPRRIYNHYIRNTYCVRRNPLSHRLTPKDSAERDITDSLSKALGSKLFDAGGGIFVLYNGDINQDCIVGPADFTSVEAKARTFSTGYLKEDLTRDRFVESVDYNIVENNLQIHIAVSRP